mmetsp:Transcript_9090/g.14751  ORF Transcript_9090/g.14751 Transcript_9090/m.14751 type:complete len:297 (-) Transcript_9090:103-993(-)
MALGELCSLRRAQGSRLCLVLVGSREFTGMALGAALEAAGRLQHRPDRRRSCLSLVQMLASCNLGWPLGAPAACTYHIQAVTRPLLHIPMVHGDVEAVQLLLNSAADAAACDSAGEPLLCHALRNVLCLGDGAREIFSLLLGSAASVPVALRDAARQHLRSSARYALQRSEPEPTYWWATGGRGLRLCRRLYVEVARCCGMFPTITSTRSHHAKASSTAPGVAPWIATWNTVEHRGTPWNTVPWPWAMALCHGIHGALRRFRDFRGDSKLGKRATYSETRLQRSIDSIDLRIGPGN